MLLSGTGASSIDELDIRKNNLPNKSLIKFFNNENDALRKEKLNEAADKLEEYYKSIVNRLSVIGTTKLNII